MPQTERSFFMIGLKLYPVWPTLNPVKTYFEPFGPKLDSKTGPKMDSAGLKSRSGLTSINWNMKQQLIIGPDLYRQFKTPKYRQGRENGGEKGAGALLKFTPKICPLTPLNDKHFPLTGSCFPICVVFIFPPAVRLRQKRSLNKISKDNLDRMI